MRAAKSGIDWLGGTSRCLFVGVGSGSVMVGIARPVVHVLLLEAWGAGFDRWQGFVCARWIVA